MRNEPEVATLPAESSLKKLEYQAKPYRCCDFLVSLLVLSGLTTACYLQEECSLSQTRGFELLTAGNMAAALAHIVHLCLKVSQAPADRIALRLDLSRIVEPDFSRHGSGVGVR